MLLLMATMVGHHLYRRGHALLVEHDTYRQLDTAVGC